MPRDDQGIQLTKNGISPQLNKLGGIFCILIVLCAASGLLLYRLGAEPLQDYDEATYAEIATENIAAANHLSFTFLDHNYFRKPPLLFWLMDVSESVISSPETGARLPSVLSGIVLVGVVILLAATATSSLYIGALAGAILTTTSAFIEPARQTRFDILVSFFIMAALYAWLQGFQKRWWYVIFGILLGLAFMTKGPLAIYAVAAVLGSCLVCIRYSWNRLRDPYFWGGVMAFFIVVVPWHVYETIHFGYAFWEDYLGDEVLNRVGQQLFNGPTNAEYLGYFFQFAAPWAFLFCIGVLLMPMFWKRMQVKAQALSLASLAGAVSVLVVCFITKTKAISYLIPLYPFMAVSIAVMAGELYRYVKTLNLALILPSPVLRRPVRLSHVISIVITLCFVPLIILGATLTVWNGFHLNPYYSSEVQLATDEKAIGEILLQQQPANFYEYNGVTTLGSIMFYSQLLSPGVYDPANPPPIGSFVVYQTSDIGHLDASTSDTSFIVMYKGQYLSLARTSVSN
jgi:4-amino-4-deoxy-L-arabinose transferase-like glycosyltransferase